MNRSQLFILFGVVSIILMLGAIYFAYQSASTQDVEQPFDDVVPFPESPVSTATTTIVVPPEVKPVPKTLADPKVAQYVFEKVKTAGWSCLDYECFTYSTSTGNWDMEYQYQFGNLLVGITGYPGLQYQLEMEQVLRAVLGLSDEELCALGVQVYWDNWETDSDSELRTLTFCPLTQ